jgi:integrase
MTIKRPKGRPNRYSVYEDILKNHAPKSMDKRPIYVNNVGIFRGKTGDRAFLKIFLRHQNKSIEIPVGKLSSWNWATLEIERDQLQGRADRNEPLEDKRPVSFKEYATGWLEIAKMRQKSYLTSKYCIEKSLMPTFGKKCLQDITVRDINLWQAKRLEAVKPATVQREKTMLKAMLNTALKEELINRNPCNSTDKIKGIHARLRYWTKEELIKILDTAEKIDPQFKDYILWALHSAMRRSEILRMEWKDIQHLPNGEIKIHIPISKSDKSRQIPCNRQMLKLLAQQRKRIPEGCKLIFSLSPKTVQRRIEEVRRLSNIEDIRLHDLRTLNITYALIAGVDPKTLTGITGHADLQMIQKHYSVVVDKALNTASEKSGNYIETLLK